MQDLRLAPRCPRTDDSRTFRTQGVQQRPERDIHHGFDAGLAADTLDQQIEHLHPTEPAHDLPSHHVPSGEMPFGQLRVMRGDPGAAEAFDRRLSRRLRAPWYIGFDGRIGH
jgi:hypothetical protein